MDDPPAWCYYYCWLHCSRPNAPFDPECCYKQWEAQHWQGQVDEIVDYYKFREELKKKYGLD